MLTISDTSSKGRTIRLNICNTVRGEQGFLVETEV